MGREGERGWEQMKREGRERDNETAEKGREGKGVLMGNGAEER